jgi:hypothetical protein
MFESLFLNYNFNYKVYDMMLFVFVSLMTMQRSGGEHKANHEDPFVDVGGSSVVHEIPFLIPSSPQACSSVVRLAPRAVFMVCCFCLNC